MEIGEHETCIPFQYFNLVWKSEYSTYNCIQWAGYAPLHFSYKLESSS